MRIRHGYHPWISYHLLGTGKIPRKNTSQNIVRFKFQMIFIRLPLKQPSGAGVWSRHDNKLELTAKINLSLDDLINMNNQYIYTFTYKKLILSVICKNGK